jgi:hypothetical protein
MFDINQLHLGYLVQKTVSKKSEAKMNYLQLPNANFPCASWATFSRIKNPNFSGQETPMNFTKLKSVCLNGLVGIAQKHNLNPI